jgi:hypothetical protein
MEKKATHQKNTFAPKANSMMMMNIALALERLASLRHRR